MNKFEMENHVSCLHTSWYQQTLANPLLWGVSMSAINTRASERGTIGMMKKRNIIDNAYGSRTRQRVSENSPVLNYTHTHTHARAQHVLTWSAAVQ